MRRLFILMIVFNCCDCIRAQQILKDTAVTIDFVSDTQEPMGVEKIYLKPTQNVRATGMIYAALLKDKPTAVFMLGDIVSLGYKNKKWNKTDLFIDSARHQGTKVYGLLGNHDVMLSDKKGERNFNKRFPEHKRTGYLEVIDSIAVLLLNSNFNKMSSADANTQQLWYQKTIDSLDKDAGTRCIIVTSHHPIFTNSNMVKPSDKLQQQYLPIFLSSHKCVLFITGHAHAFEHFKYKEKNFVVIGGGGGLHQPLTTKANMPPDLAVSYKPLFHYLQLKRYGNSVQLYSFSIKPDFSGISSTYSFVVTLQ